jgi:hypothetical protein
VGQRSTVTLGDVVHSRSRDCGVLAGECPCEIIEFLGMYVLYSNLGQGKAASIGKD